MSLEQRTQQSFQELNTHVIDKAIFGASDKMIAVVSWADLARSKLQKTYKGALEFLLRYIVPDAKYVQVTEFAKIMEDEVMKHSYDNAFRVEFYKPMILQNASYSY